MVVGRCTAPNSINSRSFEISLNARINVHSGAASGKAREEGGAIELWSWMRSLAATTVCGGNTG